MGPELVVVAWVSRGPAEVAGQRAQSLVDRSRVLQRRRRAFQAGFFILFLLAPPLDLLRFDLLETQL